MKVVSVETSVLMAVFLAGSGLFVLPAHAEDATTADVVQAVTGSAVSSAGTDEAAEVAADAAAGLPKFNSREERRAYFEKMRQENPEKFQEMKKKRQEAWLANHPKAAAKIEERKQWAKENPEEAQKMREKFRQKLQALKDKRPGPGGPDYRENRLDRRENVRDHREDLRDRAEDRRDRQEDRWDARHDGGKMDRIEDRMDRREDIRDHREDVRDHVENRLVRREDRWDAKHGPDRGKPGKGHGRPKAQRGPAGN